MKSERSGALKPDRLGLSCKVNKCSDAGTGDLGVLTTQETSQCFSLGNAGARQDKEKNISKNRAIISWGLRKHNLTFGEQVGKGE